MSSYRQLIQATGISDYQAQNLSIGWVDATGDPAQESATYAVNASLTSAPLGQTTRLQIGQYRLDTALNVTGPVSLNGMASGAGPGAVLNDHCSQVLPNFATGDVIYVGPSLYGSSFKDLQINSNVGVRTSGAGIHIDGTGLGSALANYRIDNVAFSGQYQSINLSVCHLGSISNTYHQSWKGDAVSTTGDGVHESAGPFAVQNFFFGDTASGTSQNSVFQVHNGYTRILNNLILGSQIGVRLYADTFPNGAAEVTNNWIEEQDVSGIYCFQGSSQTGTMYALNWNEFSVATLGAAARPNFQSHITIAAGTPTNWATGFQLIGNRMRTAAAAAGASFIEVQGGSFHQVDSNNLQGLTGNTTVGLRTGNSTNVKQVQMLDNLVTGAFGTRYVINNTEVMFRDFGSRLIASELSSLTVRDGSMAWCEDGMAGSNPIQGSGSGCIAIRERGAWKGLRPQTSVNRTSSTSYLVVDTDTSIAFTGSAGITVTLPSAANYAGRELVLKVEANQTVASASSNVIPLIGGAAGTAILAATAGKFAMLKSDGTAWTVMMAN